MNECLQVVDETQYIKRGSALVHGAGDILPLSFAHVNIT